MAWESCLADPFHGIAFFDGLRIDTDKLTDPRWNRVFPILEEEQIVMCRNMAQRGIFAPGRLVLDVGTGSGVLGIYAAAHGCNVEAIDQCPRAARTAKHNLGHPCNKDRIRIAGGNVSRLETISLKNFAATGRDNGKYDVVLLNPPFNPTAPGLPAASHAAAGPDGNECLIHQLPLALRLVSPSGVIAGVQMFLHDAGQCADWWKTQLLEAIASQGNALSPFHVSMVYSPLVETESIDARKFLESQYEHFLNPHLLLFPDDVKVRRYIDLVAPKDAGRQFSYVYYEIRLKNCVAGKPREPEVGPFPQIFQPHTHGKSWKDRLVLHRAIVEHTSVNHSFPVPALFLENDFIPTLQELKPQSGQRSRDVKTLYEQSPLSAVVRWIVQSRMLSEEGGVDTILIDVGPWFDSPEGRSALFQEGIVCTRSDKRLTSGADEEWESRKLILAHRANIRSFQKGHLAPLTHPAFTGKTSSKNWRPAFYQTLTSNLRTETEEGHNAGEDEFLPLGFEPKDKKRALDMFETLLKQDNQLPREKPKTEPQLYDIPDFKERHHTDNDDKQSQQIRVTYGTSSLEELDTPQLWAFENDFRNRKLLEGYSEKQLEEDPQINQQDLETVLWVFHQRIRTITKVEKNQSTAFLSLPISFANPTPRADQGKLPDNYRGAIWIFAKLSSPSTKLPPSSLSPRQESFLLDLGKMCLMLESASIAQEADKALAATIARENQTAFAHQTSSVIDSILESVSRLSLNVRRDMGGILLAKLHLLRATINSYRSRASRVNTGEFPYPWAEDQSPLEAYRDIGIQLGLARCQDAREDNVRKYARLSQLSKNQLGSPGFEQYRELFEVIAKVSPAASASLKHSSFAVLILLAIKQAVYHTIRAKFAGGADDARISVDILESSTEVLFECSIRNPSVQGDSSNQKSKDAVELQELAERLSDVDNVDETYEVEGPFYLSKKDCWHVTTRIRAKLEPKS